jgi:pilus assembly protein CpaE
MDSTPQKRILLIGRPGALEDQITTALANEREFELVGVLATTERLARDVTTTSPDIILVDNDFDQQDPLDIIDHLAIQFPEIAIIAILSDDDPVQAQQAMLAGVRAFLVQPFTQINLMSTIRRVVTLEEARVRHAPKREAEGEEETAPMKIVSVFSPRGGVGTSTIAVNLAIAHYETTGHRVLLIEGNLFFGHLEVLLNIRAKNTIADLIPHANNLDEALLADVVFSHAAGIDVLLAPSNVQIAQGIRPDDLFTVFKALERRYDFIVVDAGNTLSENVVTLLDASDRILLVTTPDLASLRDTSQFIQFSQTLAYPADKNLVVLNRAGLEGGIRESDVDNALRHQIFAAIPDDGPNALRSLNRGVPLLLRYPRSPASRSIKDLQKQLLALGLGESEAAPSRAKART